jgi:O-antigen/teichoic acid export membrane protein
VSTPAVISSLREHLRDPLYRNAYSLMFGTVLTSGLGVAYWIVAARMYPAADVGHDTALIMAMQGLALVGQLNLQTAVVRFLPQIRRSTVRAVVAVYAVTSVAVLVLAVAFVVGVPRIAGEFSFVGGDGMLAAGYVVSVVLWMLFVLQDAVLTALRCTGWIPIKYGLYGVIKLGVLVALATGAIGHGILVAWIVPAALILPVISWPLFRRLLPAHAASYRDGPSPLEVHGPRRLVRFLAQDYFGSVLGQASLLCLPLLVVGLLGGSENAYFAIPFALAMAFDLLFLNGATSLTVEGAHDERAARELTRRLVRRVFGPLVLIGALSALAAPLLLFPFGPDYVSESTWVLRLLLLGGLCRAAIFLFIAVMRLRRQSGWIMALEGSLFVMLLTLTLVLAPRFGREGVGLAWLVANGAAALVVTPWLVWFMRAEVRPLRLPRLDGAERASGTEPVSGAAAPARTRPAIGVVAVAIAACVGAPAAVLAGLHGPMALVLVLLLFLLAPGTVLVGWLRPDAVGASLGLIVGTSLAATTIAAQAMLSLHLWSPNTGLCVLAGACIVPLARQLHLGLAQRRAGDRQGAEPAVAQPLSVSVIAAGGVSGAALRATLRSVLDADAREIQVIVVDRHPDTVHVVEAVAGLSDARLLYTRAPDASLSGARDSGLRVATGDVIVFAVPDTIVHEGWLDALVEPFQDARVGCVVGRLPERGAGLRAEDLELHDSVDMVDLLWEGTHPVSFATRRDLSGAPLVTYAPIALAWEQIQRTGGLRAVSA